MKHYKLVRDLHGLPAGTVFRPASHDPGSYVAEDPGEGVTVSVDASRFEDPVYQEYFEEVGGGDTP